jgi:thiol-disulfide isomerase/thioredoxin
MKMRRLSFMVLLSCLVTGTAFAFVPQLQGLDLVSNKPAEINLALKQKALVIVFMSVHCPVSKSHLSEIKKLATEFKDFSFVGLHANQDETAAQAKVYFSEAQFSFPVLQDVKAKYANELKAAKTPHVFVISAKGDILYQGGITDSHDPLEAKEFFLRNALIDIQENHPVRIKEGRTLGCIINRGEKNVW